MGLAKRLEPLTPRVQGPTCELFSGQQSLIIAYMALLCIPALQSHLMHCVCLHWHKNSTQRCRSAFCDIHVHDSIMLLCRQVHEHSPCLQGTKTSWITYPFECCTWRVDLCLKDANVMAKLLQVVGLELLGQQPRICQPQEQICSLCMQV